MKFYASGRPWGYLDWLFSKLPGRDWSFLGAASTEDRWSEGLRVTGDHVNLVQEEFFAITPVASNYGDHHITYERLLDSAIQHAMLEGSLKKLPEKLSLLVEVERLVQYCDGFLETATNSLVFDISVVPKRFFFPFLARMMRANSPVENLVVVYSNPLSHAASLAYDVQNCRPLPLFRNEGADQPRKLFVGVGHEPHSLPEYIKDNYGVEDSIQLLLPFPPGPPGSHRALEFYREVEVAVGGGRHIEVKRVSAVDVPDVFAHIGESLPTPFQAEFAPYGPKPLSLAMCLFAARTGSQVVYSQPTRYNPQYSTGLSRTGARDEIFGYLIRWNGLNLY